MPDRRREYNRREHQRATTGVRHNPPQWKGHPLQTRVGWWADQDSGSTTAQDIPPESQASGLFSVTDTKTARNQLTAAFWEGFSSLRSGSPQRPRQQGRSRYSTCATTHGQSARIGTTPQTARPRICYQVAQAEGPSACPNPTAAGS
jgi:hypothetical protein